jgi:hypothetical protein
MDDYLIDDKTLEQRDLYLQILHFSQQTGYFNVPSRTSSNISDSVLRTKVELLETLISDYNKIFGVPFHASHFVRDAKGMWRVNKNV